ncbi:unnamed protein product, partial [Mesorhabditis spiculigera]
MKLVALALLVGVALARPSMEGPQNFGFPFFPPGQHGAPAGHPPAFGGFPFGPGSPPPPFGGFPFGPGGPPPPPPFLKDVDEDARDEFMKLFENENLSRSEFRNAVAAWAAKQGEKTQQAVQEFNTKMEKAKEESRQKFDRVVSEIVPALQQLKALYENEALTRKERRKQKHAIIDELSVETGFAVSLITKMLRPRPPMPPPPPAQGGEHTHGPEAGSPPPPPPGFPAPVIGFGPRPFFPPPPPPFLAKVSDEAKDEFRKLIENEDLPRSDFKRELELWAEKQGAEVQEAVKKFEHKLDTGLEESSTKIRALFQHLPQAFNELEQALKDDTLSRKQAHKKIRQIFDDLDRKEAQIAHQIMFTFGPKPPVTGAIALPFGFEPQFNGFQEHLAHHRPEFLKEVSSEARSDFMEIITDEDMTRKEYHEKVREWAKKHGVAKEQARFEKDMEEEKEEATKGFDKLVEELLPAVKAFRAVLENEELSRRQVRKQTHQIEDSLSEPTSMVLHYILDIFKPHHRMLTQNDREQQNGQGQGFGAFVPMQPFAPMFQNQGFFPQRPPFMMPGLFGQKSPKDSKEIERMIELQDIPRQEVERKMIESQQRNGGFMMAKTTTEHQEKQEEKQPKLNNTEQMLVALEHLKPALEEYGQLYTTKDLSISKARKIFDNLTLKEAIAAQQMLNVFNSMPEQQMMGGFWMEQPEESLDQYDGSEELDDGDDNNDEEESKDGEQSKPSAEKDTHKTTKDAHSRDFLLRRR